MMTQVVVGVASVVGTVGPIVLWWLHHRQARVREKVHHDLMEVEHALAEALARRDADAVAACNTRLRELSGQARRLLSPRGG